MNTPYVTQKRPVTEPYAFWAERRRLQKKDLRLYLKGRIMWISCWLENTAKPLEKPVFKKRKVQGTFKYDTCLLCLGKLKHKNPKKGCKCGDLI